MVTGSAAQLTIGCSTRARPVKASATKNGCDEVGDEQAQRAAEDRPIKGGEAEAHHRQRRHQGGGDRHPHDRAFTPADHRIGSGQRGKQRDQQVEQIGPRARGDFLGHRLQRREIDDQRTEQDREDRPCHQRLAAAPQPIGIARGEREAGAEDRVHQRREQHGADDHRRRRQQQAQDRDPRAHRGHEDIAAGEQRFAAHAFDRGDMVEIGDHPVAPPHAHFDQRAQYRQPADRPAFGVVLAGFVALGLRPVVGRWRIVCRHCDARRSDIGRPCQPITACLIRGKTGPQARRSARLHGPNS